MNEYDFKFPGRYYDYYEVNDNYIRVLFQSQENENEYYFYELHIYKPELIKQIKELKPKQPIGVLGHYEELIYHPDRGLTRIELELVVDEIFTSKKK